MYPKDYRYTKSHEWLSIEGNRVKMGVTDHAQGELGDVVFIELPEVGKTIKAGDAVATIESVKTVAYAYSPLAGKIVEVNGELDETPEKVNHDAHGDGWMVVLEADDLGPAKGLMDAAGYEKFLEQESGH